MAVGKREERVILAVDVMGCLVVREKSIGGTLQRAQCHALLQ